MSIVWLNNEFLEDSAANISLRDAGLLHAAGVFTTMRSYGGKVFRLDLHLQRLRRSCEALFIPLQYKNEVLLKATEELLRRNDLPEARLRLTVTRGVADQDPLHGLRLSPTAFLTATELSPYPREYYERGLTVILLDDQKLNPHDLQAGHKTLNYFSRLAALRAANQRSAGEALWFNVHHYLQSDAVADPSNSGRKWAGGNLQSGSISNVFLIESGRLVTPPTADDLKATPDNPEKSAVLPGVTRAVVIELAKAAGLEVETTAVDVNRLLAADEIFLTNSIMGLMPVCRIERHAVGNDRPGPVTRQLMDLYAEAVAGG